MVLEVGSKTGRMTGRDAGSYYSLDRSRFEKGTGCTWCSERRKIPSPPEQGKNET